MIKAREILKDLTEEEYQWVKYIYQLFNGQRIWVKDEKKD